MKIRCLLPSLLTLYISVSCAQNETAVTQISWDTYGVPHIYANTLEDLFFAQGWAQMKNHANLITELYGSARGKGAEYWGVEKLPNDVLIHTLGFGALADNWEASQEAEIKTIYASFVKGLNAYAEAHPEAIDQNNRVVLPLTTRDLNMHSMYVIFTRFIAGNDLGRVQQWPDIGSNTMAIGPRHSASGYAMLVQNPHLPWWGEFLFFESHLNLKGKNMYGTTLVGFPGIAIGFNDHLGWSHTDNTIDNADTYELELKDGGYLLDGERKEFEASLMTIRVKEGDGTFTDHPVTLQRTIHGPVVNKSATRVLALRMAGLDRPNMFLQWWRMINSTGFEEFESALMMAQIPFWNVMYADKDGQIFYLFNGLVPKRNSGDWEYWDRVIPGGRSSDIWTEVHSYRDLPKVRNPINGWLQNANDPPWTCTIPPVLNPGNYPAYMAPQYMPFRPQRVARLLMEDTKVTFEELVDYKLSTRLEFADRILDDLFGAIDRFGSERTKAAKRVLERWDREADANSKGTVLFYQWARKFNVWDNANYATKWDGEAPTSTPDGLADPEAAVRLLDTVATGMQSTFGTLEIPWGDYYRIRYNGKDLPANGIDGSMGVIRVAWPSDADDTHMYVGGGDSWVGIIEFADQVHARVLLSYGNASQKDSPYNGDQLELFTRKEMRDAWFTRADVKAHTVTTEYLTNNGFRETP